MKSRQTTAIVIAAVGCLVLLALNPYLPSRTWTLGLAVSLCIVCVLWVRFGKPTQTVAGDSDICLAIASLLKSASPHPSRQQHTVFLRREMDSANAQWTGPYLLPTSAFQLKESQQTQLVELFEQLWEYYQRHQLGHWNVAHFAVMAGSQKFRLAVEFAPDLASGERHFEDFLKRFS